MRATELISLARAYLAATKALNAYVACVRRDGCAKAHASPQFFDATCKCASFVIELDGLLAGRNHRAWAKYMECARREENRPTTNA